MDRPLGVIVAIAVAIFLPPNLRPVHKSAKAEHHASGARGGFALLLAIGILDSSVRMGFLTFLPFLLKEQGASLSVVGQALALVFIGGATGKFACGWLVARFGVLATVLLTEAGTAALILAVLVLPLAPTLVLLPILGVMLNGTSSVLYGTVSSKGRTTSGCGQRNLGIRHRYILGGGKNSSPSRASRSGPKPWICSSANGSGQRSWIMRATAETSSAEDSRRPTDISSMSSTTQRRMAQARGSRTETEAARPERSITTERIEVCSEAALPAEEFS